MEKQLIFKMFRYPSYLMGYIRYFFRSIYVQILPDIHPKFGPHYKKAIVALLKVSRRNWKKNYTIGAILGALQAKNCGYNDITLIEFGVSTGGGFKSLMMVANEIRKEMNMKVRVVGFDNRSGLPKPLDFRDHPEIWNQSQFAMGLNYEDIDAYTKRNNGEIIIGDISETLPKFSLDNSVLAFASIDVDFYSSTKPITSWLSALSSEALLPASVLYFDDVINNWTFSSATGEALAIEEFNRDSNSRFIELKYPDLKLFALHDFKNRFRIGEKSPQVQLELIVKDIESYYTFPY